MQRFMRRWGALVILALLWLGSTAAHYHYGGQVQRKEAEQHGQPYDPGEHRNTWLAETFENYQSEWAQLLLQSILLGTAAHLLFRKSKEDEEKMERELGWLHERVESLQSSLDAAVIEIINHKGGGSA